MSELELNIFLHNAYYLPVLSCVLFPRFGFVVFARLYWFYSNLLVICYDFVTFMCSYLNIFVTCVYILLDISQRLKFCSLCIYFPQYWSAGVLFDLTCTQPADAQLLQLILPQTLCAALCVPLCSAVCAICEVPCVVRCAGPRSTRGSTFLPRH